MTMLLCEHDINRCADCPFCDDFDWCKVLHKKVKEIDTKLGNCPLIHLDDSKVLEAIGNVLEANKNV